MTTNLDVGVQTYPVSSTVSDMPIFPIQMGFIKALGPWDSSGSTLVAALLDAVGRRQSHQSGPGGTDLDTGHAGRSCHGSEFFMSSRWGELHLRLVPSGSSRIL